MPPTRLRRIGSAHPGTGSIQSWSLIIQTGVANPTGSPGNYMDQNSDGKTADQARSNLDIFRGTSTNKRRALPAASRPGDAARRSTATATAPAPFQLPYVSNSLPLIIPGPRGAAGILPLAEPRIARADSQPGALEPAHTRCRGHGNNHHPGVLNSTISITDVPVGQVISDLTVSVSIDHTQDSDLVLT